jgi:glycosyltransferase involved in cell wall biosynthesis
VTRRLVIITEIISPYRIPLFNALAKRSEVDLHVIFLAETDPQLRQWQVYKNEIKFSCRVLRSYRRRIGRFHALINFGMGGALSDARPDVILCGGYNYLASWHALLWARAHSVPFFLWSESNLRDMRSGRAPVEMLKGEFLRRCSGFVVPGKSAKDFLLARGIKDRMIFNALNAVDNDLFAAAASLARANAGPIRNECGLPGRYFLFVGRLVREKGIFELLSAYATLDEDLRRAIGLVFVGDGPLREALEREAATISSGMIRFVGFAQRDDLPKYYALADMMILPTYTDTWGLVVNEAMACGLPVILSAAAGCGQDLVTENWNGRVVPSRDVQALASAMRDIAEDSNLRSMMGARSGQRIREYSPEAWSEGIATMMAAGQGQ